MIVGRNKLQQIRDAKMEELLSLSDSVIQTAMNNIGSPSKWFDKSAYYQATEEITLSSIYAGIDAGGQGAITLASLTATSEYYLYSNYKAGTLSSRLRVASDKMESTVNNIMRTHIKNKTTWRRAQASLNKVGASIGDVPKWLTDLEQTALYFGGDRKMVQQKLKEAQRALKRLRPDRELQRKYKAVVTAVESGNYDRRSLRRAMQEAISQKAIYNNERIVRTELARAYNDAFWRYTEDRPEITLVKHTLSSGHPKPDECTVLAEVDSYGVGGGVYPIGKVHNIPVHANCVIGETLIESHTSIDKAFYSVYSGDVIKITVANGRSVTVTVNHPVLTQRGWVRAGSIRNTDYLVNTVACDDAGLTATPYNNGSVPTAKELCESLMMSSNMITTAVPATSKDLHNDGEFIKGNINIVSSDSLLRGDSKTPFSNRSSEINFGGRDISSSTIFNSSSSFFEIGNTPLGASDGVVCFGGDFGEKLLSSISLLPESFSLFGGSPSDVIGFKDTLNNPSGDIEAFRNRVFTFSFLVSLDNRFGVLSSSPLSVPLRDSCKPTFKDGIDCGGVDANFSGNSSLTHSLRVEFENVTSVLTSHVENLRVYNFETDITNIYSGNGIVLHNCLCMWEPLTRHIDDKRKARYSQERTDETLSNYPDGIVKRYNNFPKGINPHALPKSLVDYGE